MNIKKELKPAKQPSLKKLRMWDQAVACDVCRALEIPPSLVYTSHESGNTPALFTGDAVLDDSRLGKYAGGYLQFTANSDGEPLLLLAIRLRRA